MNNKISFIYIYIIYIYNVSSQVGLKAEYDKKDNPVLRFWIRQLLTLTVLPVFAIPLAWTRLKDALLTGSPSADALQLSSHFDRTWLNGFFPPSLWSHYINLRPRTANVAEVSTHASLCHIHLFGFFWIGFRSANTASSVVEYNLLSVGHRNLDTVLCSAGQRVLVSQSQLRGRDRPHLLPCIATCDLMRLRVSFRVQQCLIFDIRLTCWNVNLSL